MQIKIIGDRESTQSFRCGHAIQHRRI